MKRTWPFHPPLLAAFPVLSLYSTNLSLVPLSQLWRPLGLAVAAALAVWALGSLIFRDVRRGALAASVVLVGFFAFAWIRQGLGVMGIGGSFAIGLCAALVLAVAYLASRGPKLTQAGNVLAAMLVLVTLSRAGLGYAQSRTAVAGVEGSAAATARSRPDIFYIILDGYGRSDAIRRAIGYRNDDFIEGLRKRGFFVADRSRANYCQTEISLASSLNMETIPRLLPNAKPEWDNRAPLAAKIQDNAVVRETRRRGYATVTVTTGFPPVRLNDADLTVEGERQGLTLLESALIGMTPIGLQESAYHSQFDIRRERLKYAFAALESLGARTSKPRFVLAHILAPHPPFVFAADGSPVRQKGPFGFWDGSDFDVYVGDDEVYRKGYAGQIAYLNRRILAVVDRILAAPGPRPIIVLQGDHGSKVGLDQNSLEKTDVGEVFPILNAYYVPDDIRAKLDPEITPVNTFRVIFSSLFGLPLERLPDRSWYSEYARPYAFTDVTERIR